MGFLVRGVDGKPASLIFKLGLPAGSSPAGSQQMCAGPWEERRERVIPHPLHFKGLSASTLRRVTLRHPVSVVTVGDGCRCHLVLLWQALVIFYHLWLSLEHISHVRRDFENHALPVLAPKPSLCFLCLLPQMPNHHFVST